MIIGYWKFVFIQPDCNKRNRAIQNQQMATVREKEGIKKLPGLSVPVKPDQESQSEGSAWR